MTGQPVCDSTDRVRHGMNTIAIYEPHHALYELIEMAFADRGLVVCRVDGVQEAIDLSGQHPIPGLLLGGLEDPIDLICSLQHRSQVVPALINTTWDLGAIDCSIPRFIKVIEKTSDTEARVTRFEEHLELCASRFGVW